jgi:hypothetical protein
MDPINYSGMLQPSQAGGIISDFFAKQVAQRKLDAYRNDIGAAMANPTAQAFSALALKYPEQREAFKDAWGNLSAEQRDSDYLSGVQAYTALQNGSPEVAADILDKQIAARKNSGKDASKIEAVRSALDADPTSVQGNLGFILSAIDPEKWSKMTTAQTALQQAPEELRAKRAAATTAEAEAGVAPEMQAQTLKQKSAEAAIKQVEANFAPDKIAADLEQTYATTDASRASAESSRASAAKTKNEVANPGLIPPDKKPEYEGKLRAEYNAQTQPYRLIQDAYGRMQQAEKTGAGDVSLIYGYMKMLDPTSVVREGEYATAANTTGLPDQIMNLYNKAVDGQKLPDTARKSILSQSGKLAQNARDDEDKVRKGLARIAGKYGLDPENIFYQTEDQRAESSPSSNRVVYRLDTATGQLIPEGQ